MIAFILLALIAVPMVEIGLFIVVGTRIGLWPTLSLVVLTAIVGTALLRAQGISVLRRAQAALARSEMPVVELIEGACLLFAGALLLTPGFATDAFGLLLLIPAVRLGMGRYIWRRLSAHGGVHIHAQGGAGRGGPVIDGEFEDLSPDRSDATASNAKSLTNSQDTTRRKPKP